MNKNDHVCLGGRIWKKAFPGFVVQVRFYWGDLVNTEQI